MILLSSVVLLRRPLASGPLLRAASLHSGGSHTIFQARSVSSFSGGSFRHLRAYSSLSSFSQSTRDPTPRDPADDRLLREMRQKRRDELLRVPGHSREEIGVAPTAAAHHSRGTLDEKDDEVDRKFLDEVAHLEAEKLVKKSMWTRFKNEMVHYWHGLKLLSKEVGISARLVGQLLQGKQLTRREKRQVRSEKG